MNTLPLEQVTHADIASVGGKAASLGELMQLGITVPPGFVITTEAGSQGMTPQLQEEILATYRDLGSERVAVRSSAIAEDSKEASWAGQLETCLNVKEDGILEAVQRCWASIGSEHAQAYGSHHGLDQDGQRIAVIIQAMVDSEVSGVMFTVNPVTNNKNEAVIESIYGLGEMIVQGAVTPENFVISKETAEVVAHSPGRQRTMLTYRGGKNQETPLPAEKRKKPSLQTEQIEELNRIGQRIEAHYGHPQDIEWAIAKGGLYLVQSRPITTLAETEEGVPAAYTYEKIFTREESLMFGEIEYEEFAKWLAEITDEAIPPTVCRINDGLLEVWLCREATQIFVDEIYRRNMDDEGYLKRNIEVYDGLVAEMEAFEQQGAARNLKELEQYLALFRKAIVPLHVIFFTPFREDTPKPLLDLAMKVRSEDAMFDNSDLFVRESLTRLYPDCNGLETLIGLADLDDPDPEALKRRENDFFWAENRYLAIDLDEFQESYPSYNFLIDEIDPDQKVITGTIAYRGRAKGTAEVITRKRDIAGFEAGNILVAPMTTPHYLPAMRHAKAFVTDEGGVTCHAAIVSRELKTPCIIGTKIATQVLETGDIVLVDADEGKVFVR